MASIISLPREQRLTGPRPTARAKIFAVIRWAEGAGFYNIAAELRDAVSLLPADDAATAETRPGGVRQS
jgi:hypothetical protein